MAVQYAFPKEEAQFYTALRLSEYRRPRPGAAARMSTEIFIRLPIPEQLSDNYSMELNKSALGLAGMANLSGLPTIKDMYTGGAQLASALKSNFSGTIRDMMGKVSQYAESVAPGVVDTLGKVASTDPAKFLALTPGVSDNIFGQAAQLQTGMVRNPHMTTLFDGVNLREFTFTWKLSPKTSEEASEMANMVTTLKRYMHPSLTLGGFAYEYPYLAEVEFVGGDYQYVNSTLPKVSKSFISGMSVNNLTQGTAAFYTDGRPVSIDLSLGFNEVNVKTREDFTVRSSGLNGGVR